MRRYSRLLFLKIFLLFVFCMPCAAQYNFYKFSVGAGAGITYPFSDTRNANYSFANQLIVDYYFTPYIQTGVEFQFGNMRGGLYDRSHFTNNFQLISWNAKMQLGQFYDRYDRLTVLTSLMRGLYAGVGVGVIQNNVEAYLFDQDNPDGLKIESVNSDLIFPFHVGLNFYFRDFHGRDRWELNFNMQYVAMMADKLDGDLNPRSNYNDVYNYFSSGIRYKFGSIGLDQRRQRVR
ncbi:outer membrane beta-barrel protein [Pedobacter sp. Du54]|uniref:outer membrane beta-barrel protein n=1 Tax=Pedobacter anseongensis TaxID=3133439 RepID=UPI00309E0C74